MEAILNSIYQALDWAMSHPIYSTVIAGALDWIMGRFPTKKPLGIIHLVIDMGAKLGALLIKLRDARDKLLPQRVKDLPLVNPDKTS